MLCPWLNFTPSARLPYQKDPRVSPSGLASCMRLTVVQDEKIQINRMANIAPVTKEMMPEIE